LAWPASAAGVDIRVATAYAADSFQTQNLQRYAEDVAASTSGEVRMTLYPAGSLIKPAEIFGGVRDGRTEAGEVILSSLANESPLFAIDTLPFIVSSYEDARLMWDVSRPAIEKAFAERGLQLLYAVPWPPQNLYSRQPLNGIQDFRGLRMRSYNPATVRISELVRAKPVTIQAVDLPRALADDKFDLMITSSWTGVEVKAWLKLQHYYRVNAWIPKNVVFINKKVFDRLGVSVQKKMLEAAHIAEERGWKMSRDSDRQFEEQLAANRMDISNIDPFMRRYLDRLGETLTREWLKKAGVDEMRILLSYTTERSARTASKVVSNPGLLQ
jgi:TRAP-type C4-dicarboxylate transport system substrate-binding protein